MADEPAAPPRGARPVKNSRGFGANDDGDDMMADVELSMSHDQLPSAEEYKASSPPTRSLTNKRGRVKRYFLIGIAIAVFSIIIIIGISFGRKQIQIADSSNSREPNSSSGGGDEMVSRMEEMVQFVAKQGWSPLEVVEKEGTAQFRAALWVADYDGKQLPVNEASLDLRQRYALATLYFALDGRSWSRDTGFLAEADVCDWFEHSAENDPLFAKSVQLGVDCQCVEEEDPNDTTPCQSSSVKRIKIPSAKLDGYIPDEIQLLIDLEELDLHDNYITGAFPAGFRNLQKLKTLSLQFNSLQGELPIWMGELKSVKTLNLASNKLSGLIPIGIMSMESLRVLNLDDNQISGSLETLRDMSNVQALLLGKNQLSGQLSAELLSSWSQVDVLDLSDNKLNGQLPANLFTQEHLAVLDLHFNNFEGAIPDVNVQSYDSSALQFLALQGNQLLGQIPQSLGRLQRLYHLDLANNTLTGQIPIELGTLTELKYLFLAFNGFDADPIPDFLQGLTNLVDLSLQATQRTGVIPDFMGKLDKMWLLDLAKNQLSGGVPNALTNCTELRFLMLHDNNLEGEFPANIRDLQNLHYLFLDGNAIGGQVSEYCNLALPAIESIRMTCNKAFQTSDEPYCPCCDCCGDAGVDCESTVWYGDFDPSWDTQYVRDEYQFYDADDSPYLVEPGSGYRSNGNTPVVPGTGTTSNPLPTATTPPGGDDSTPAPAPAPAGGLFENPNSEETVDDTEDDPEYWEDLP